MTWENLTADADALREKLGFERWAVLGHSFGGHVALEYALRYPDRLSHPVLLDTGGDSHWARQNAPELLAKRGYSPEKVELHSTQRATADKLTIALPVDLKQSLDDLCGRARAGARRSR